MEENEKSIIQDFNLILKHVNLYSIISPIIVCYLGTKVADLYVLHREAKPKDMNFVRIPPDIDIDLKDKDIEELINNISRKDMFRFAKFLYNHFDNKDLVNFYNNFKSLEIREKNFAMDNLLLRFKTAGEYSPKYNVIYLADNCNYAIYHELFHVASSVRNSGAAYSGFHHVTKNVLTCTVGKALNEGYTELLSHRYFPGPGKTYKYQVSCTEKIERIVGQEKMEKLYLNADLGGLIAELNKYISEEEIMKFLANMDFVLSHTYDKTMILYKESLMNRAFKEINQFLIKCYANSFVKKVNEGYFLNEGDIARDLITYMSSINQSAFVGKREYDIMTSEEATNYLQECINSNEKSFSM